MKSIVIMILTFLHVVKFSEKYLKLVWFGSPWFELFSDSLHDLKFGFFFVISLVKMQKR